ncbi:hypothetical protein J2T60_000358 [Natronospira proteinivora]|uniref:YfaZ n=1 Tax=Natronospira proteinivora TaxID=1807133 RepID=A0ABT1G7Q5_9GAMM|nr:YfaZ family outer membrane protein [Natronospira proteinivora]MCP1726393.1 hypothetical protein [Natronospira proteinivora]
MFKVLKIITISFFLLGSGPVAALTLDLNLSDESAELKVANQGGILETQFSWIHEQDHGDVLGLALHMVDDANPGGSRLDMGIGGRVLAVDTPGPDGLALAIGGYFRYTIPNMNRLGIGGDLYHAPSIVSGGDLERYTQWAIRGEYQILRQANVYLGYRQVRPDFGGGSETLDSGIHVGLRLNF